MGSNDTPAPVPVQPEQPGYVWVPGVGANGRYRDVATGRFVKGSAVRSAMDAYLDKSDDAAGAASQALRDGKISLADWQTAMMRQIKIAHMNAAATAVGGYANMTPSDYGRAGAAIKEQYQYLRKFAEDIAAGKQKLDGRMVYRAKMYIQAARETMYKIKRGAAKLFNQIDMVRSKRNARDSCIECIELDGVWFRLDDPNYKPPGNRICAKNCRCHEEYGKSGKDGEIDSLEVL